MTVVFAIVIFHDFMQETECAYVIILMAVYWCTEVLPLAVTALLPALLFPLFGVMKSKDVSKTAAAVRRNFCLATIHFCLHTQTHPMCVPGVYAVPEGHKPAVCGGTDGCSSCGTLESAQAHRVEGAAPCWRASSTVSRSHTTADSLCLINF